MGRTMGGVVLSSDVADDLHDPVRARAELVRLRPDLLERYDAALPAATAAIMARLLGALAREQLPGLAGRREAPTGLLRVTLGSGLVVIFPTAAAAPFAEAPAGLTARLFAPAGPHRTHGEIAPAVT